MTHPTLVRTWNRQANPRWLAAFRIGYAVVGLELVLSALAFRNLLWPAGSHEAMIGIAGLGCAAALLVCIGLGFGGGFVRWVHFGVVLWLRERLPSVHLDFLLYQLIGFLLAFADLNATWSIDGAIWRQSALSDRAVRTVSGWPMWMMGLVLGIWLLNAGISKLVDPLWRNGLGLYYALLQPWAARGKFQWLFDQRFLVETANWCVIAADLLWLPLFLIPRTRFLAVFVGFVFFTALVYPLGIDPVGEFGWVCCLGLMSISGRGEVAPSGARSVRLLPFALAAFAAMSLVDVQWVRVCQALDGRFAPEAGPPLAIKKTVTNTNVLGKVGGRSS